MSREIGRIAVIGAGTMGHGIAQVAAMAGLPVMLVDTTQHVLSAALDRIRANLDEGVRRGKVAETVRDAALANIAADTSLENAVRGADLVVEAVPERLDLKRRVFAELEQHAPATAILATNTSGLSITEIQQDLRAPGRVLGLHFFNPVHINALVEVVRGGHTDAAVVDAGVDFARRLGKDPIVVKDSPGFASSRLGVLLGLEAMRMLEEGVADAEAIDKAMEVGYRHPMGPLRLTDLVGLDVRLDIARYLHAKLGDERFRPPAILERLVAEGHLGKKTGRGFYTWER